jgi:GDP-L-fucose synthase
MRVLVTGASGFLGRSLCAALRAGSHDVVEVSSRVADLRVAGSLDRFADARVERIFHLAAWTQAGDFCLRHPGEQWIVNQQMNTNVLAWWRDRQPQAKLIAVGSSCSYAPDGALTEDRYLEGMPIESLFAYAMTKRMLYAGLIALERQFGFEYLHVVPATLYGPDYHTDDRQLHFIFDLIRKILRGKLHGEPVVLWGDGEQERELIFVDDFTRVALELCDRVRNETVNIGSGEQHTIRWFAESICAEVGFDSARIEYDTTRYVGARSKLLSNAKLRGLLPGVTFTPLETGLRRTIAWMRREMTK